MSYETFPVGYRPASGSKLERVLVAMRDRGPMCAQQVADASGVDVKTCGYYLRILLRARLVEQVERGTYRNTEFRPPEPTSFRMDADETTPMAVLRHLRRHGGTLTVDDIRAVRGGRRNVITASLQDLVDSGQLERLDVAGKPGYQLPERQPPMVVRFQWPPSPRARA